MRTWAPRSFPVAGRPVPEEAHRARTPEIVSLAFVLTALFLTPLVLSPADTQIYYLALVLTVLTALPVVARIASGTLDPFEPIIPVSMLIGLAFGVRTMYLAYDPVTLFPLRTGQLRADEFIGSALLLTIAGYASLLAGYYVIAGNVSLSAPPRQRREKGTWRPAALKGHHIAVLLGLSAVAAVISRPSITDAVTSATTSTAVLGSLAQLGACVLALHLAAGDQRRWLRLALWCVAVPMGAWQSLVLGAKTPILLMLYAILAGYHYGGRRVPLRALVAGVLLSIIVVFPFVNAYRSPPGRYMEPPASAGLVDQLIAYPTRFAGMTPGEYLQYAGEGVLSRSTGIDALSLLLKYDVSRELGNATAYCSIPLYAFVPRVIWPSKPVLAQGAEAGRLLAVPSFEGLYSFSSFGIFHLGDLFVTFGVAGVMIGMCLLGCLYRLIYRFFNPLHASDLGMKFIYIFLTWHIVNGFESDVPSVYASLLRSLVVWVPIKLWLNARPSNDARRQYRLMHPGMARPNPIR